MGHSIVQKKLLLLHQEYHNIAKQVYSIQSKLRLPVLVQECQKYLVLFVVTDITKSKKSQWKAFIKKWVWVMNEEYLLGKLKQNARSVCHIMPVIH